MKERERERIYNLHPSEDLFMTFYIRTHEVHENLRQGARSKLYSLKARGVFFSSSSLLSKIFLRANKRNWGRVKYRSGEIPGTNFVSLKFHRRTTSSTKIAWSGSCEMQVATNDRNYPKRGRREGGRASITPVVERCSVIAGEGTDFLSAIELFGRALIGASLNVVAHLYDILHRGV